MRIPFESLSRTAWRPFARRGSFGIALGLALALAGNAACAAALGSVPTPVGLLAALAAVFLVKNWPSYLSASAWSTVFGTLAMAGAVMWFRRARVAERALGFAFAGRLPGLAPRPLVRECAAPVVALPEGFARESLMVEFRAQFLRLQEAWDRGDLATLGALTTPEMLDELCAERARCESPRDAQRTDVVTLHAELLGFEAWAPAFVASVEFSGLMRERGVESAVAFRELWLLTRSKDEREPGWRLARHQAWL